MMAYTCGVLLICAALWIMYLAGSRYGRRGRHGKRYPLAQLTGRAPLPYEPPLVAYHPLPDLPPAEYLTDPVPEPSPARMPSVDGAMIAALAAADDYLAELPHRADRARKLALAALA